MSMGHIVVFSSLWYNGRPHGVGVVGATEREQPSPALPRIHTEFGKEANRFLQDGVEQHISCTELPLRTHMGYIGQSVGTVLAHTGINRFFGWNANRPMEFTLALPPMQHHPPSN